MKVISEEEEKPFKLSFLLISAQKPVVDRCGSPFSTDLLTF